MSHSTSAFALAILLFSTFTNVAFATPTDTTAGQADPNGVGVAL